LKRFNIPVGFPVVNAQPGVIANSIVVAFAQAFEIIGLENLCAKSRSTQVWRVAACRVRFSRISTVGQHTACHGKPRKWWACEARHVRAEKGSRIGTGRGQGTGIQPSFVDAARFARNF